MNGIVEIIISLSEHSKVEVPKLCHETDCTKVYSKKVQCSNCPLCSIKFTKPNTKLFYGDEND